MAKWLYIIALEHTKAFPVFWKYGLSLGSPSFSLSLPSPIPMCPVSLGIALDGEGNNESHFLANLSEVNMNTHCWRNKRLDLKTQVIKLSVLYFASTVHVFSYTKADHYKEMSASSVIDR